MAPSRSAGSVLLTLDPAVVARGAELLHGQCWLWGQDLRSPRGNLLEACGLEYAVFEGSRSHRRYYRGRLEGGRFVVAWSGGVLLGDQFGSRFFPRLRFEPHRLDEVRSLEELPNLNAIDPDPSPTVPRDDPLVVATLDWLAAYEDSAVRHAGRGWRERCARRWAEIEEGARAVAASVGVRYDPLPPLPPGGLAGSWKALRSEVAAGGLDESGALQTQPR